MKYYADSNEGFVPSAVVASEVLKMMAAVEERPNSAVIALSVVDGTTSRWCDDCGSGFEIVGPPTMPEANSRWHKEADDDGFFRMSSTWYYDATVDQHRAPYY